MLWIVPVIHEFRGFIFNFAQSRSSLPPDEWQRNRRISFWGGLWRGAQGQPVPRQRDLHLPRRVPVLRRLRQQQVAWVWLLASGFRQTGSQGNKGSSLCREVGWNNDAFYYHSFLNFCLAKWFWVRCPMPSLYVELTEQDSQDASYQDAIPIFGCHPRIYI